MSYTVIFIPVIWIGPWMPDSTEHLFSSLWWNCIKCQCCSPVQVLAWAVCKRCRGEPSYEIALKHIQCSWIGVDEELGTQSPLIVEKAHGGCSSWRSIYNFDLESLTKLRVYLGHLCTLQLWKEIVDVSHLIEDRNMQKSGSWTEAMSAAQVVSHNAFG